MVRDELVELRGLRFHYRDWPAAKPGAQDLLLLHGYTGAAAAHGATSAAGLWRRSSGGWDRVPDPPGYCMGGDFLALAADDVWSAGLACEQ
jgi:hypothetical protein